MLKKTKTIKYDPMNFKKTRMTTVIYGAGDQKIRASKTVVKPNKVKTVTYGPADYHGKQTKTKTVVKKGKTRAY